MKYAILLFVLTTSVCQAQDDGPIKVHLTSGEVITTRYIYLDHQAGFGKAFLRIRENSKEKIMIDDVDYVDGPDQTGKQRYIRPIEYYGETVWGERTFVSDRITMYYVGVVTWGVGFPMRSKYFQYSKDDGPLRKVTIANVQRDVGDNAESMAFVKKSKANVGVQVGFYAAGITLAIASAVKWGNTEEPTGPVSTRNTDVKIPPAVFIGVGLCVVPSIIKPGKQKNLVNALEAYK